MPDSIAIKLENVSKKYSIGKEKDGSLRGTLGGMFSKKSASTEDFWALKDVSFDIQKGDVIGIIGKNGAGKSTLLKILSQITKPTEGRIEINGRVASLLEVGTGFHPELTGRENVFLNGTILGMTRKEVAAKFDEIVAFSGVEKFIDTPVKRYSSGMYVRLAFAVAAHLEPEILIIDEVLAVGDAEFQKKCLGKMKDVAGEGRTVIFVSHDLAAVEKLCEKLILIKNGEIFASGDTIDMINLYVQDGKKNNSNIKDVLSRKGNGLIKFTDAFWQNKKENSVINQIQSLTSCAFIVQLDQEIDLSKTRIDIGINDSKNIRVAWLSSYFIDNESRKLSNQIEFEVEHFNLAPGDYNCNLYCETNSEVNDWLEFVLPFVVIDRDYYNTGKSLPKQQGYLLMDFKINLL